jgi:CHRD domain-containing protein
MRPGIPATAALVAALVIGDASARPATNATSYIADLASSSEVPSNMSTGMGTATLTLDDAKLSYTIRVTGLTGPATAAHIHLGAMGVSGPVIYPFNVTKLADGTVASGSIDLKKPITATISGDSLKTLLNTGNAYVNVHTAANPGGEIRGQIIKK